LHFCEIHFFLRRRSFPIKAEDRASVALFPFS
jgi:hypothetical protein